MNKYTFGPIHSRRFGLSLGIDLSPDEKSCNFDCLYCELKGAKPTDTIKNPPLVDHIIAEVQKKLQEEDKIEVITITSNGEPTLYERLDELVEKLNKIKGEKKLLILSNGSTIDKDSIQDTLKKIDIIKLSLDCATKKCFKKIDRPLKNINLDNIKNGILKFRKIYNGELVIEILVLKGINDNKNEMQELNKILNQIKPNRIDLGTIDRPPAYEISGVSTDKLVELSNYFENLPISIIHKNRSAKMIDYTKNEILFMLKRRPQSDSDVQYLFSDISKNNLKELENNGLIKKISIASVNFYKIQ